MSRVEPNRNVYVGHRYVPKIMGEWDKSIAYEGLSIVLNKGGSYTSKKRVPVGIDILNEEFWAITGNYNAQVDYYRQETQRVSEDLLKKSDQTYVNTELGKKANKTYVDTELDKKSDISYVNTELGKKSDKTYVDTELDKKSDLSYVNTELGKKSNQTYVNTELDKKVNKSDLSVNMLDFEHLKQGNDYTPVLQGAIDTGKSVNIPNGNFELYSPVYPKQNSKISGQGNKTKLIVKGTGGFIFSGNGGAYTQLSDFWIEGASNNATMIKYHDSVNGYAIRWAIRNVRFSTQNTPETRVGTTAIELHGGWIADIYNPIIQFFETGLKVIENEEFSKTSYNSLNIFGGEIQGNTVGVYTEHCLGVNFFGTAIEGQRKNGVIIGTGSRMVSFNNCYFEANGLDDKVGTNDISVINEVIGGLPYGISINSCLFLRAVGCNTAVGINGGSVSITGATAFQSYTSEYPAVKVAELFGGSTKLMIDDNVNFGANGYVENNGYSSGFKDDVSTSMKFKMVSGEFSNSPALLKVINKTVSNNAKVGFVLNSSIEPPAGSKVFLRVNLESLTTGRIIHYNIPNVEINTENKLIEFNLNMKNVNMYGERVLITLQRLGNYPDLDDLEGDLNLSGIYMTSNVAKKGE